MSVIIGSRKQIFRETDEYIAHQQYYVIDRHINDEGM
jgi:hypothetical protein